MPARDVENIKSNSTRSLRILRKLHIDERKFPVTCVDAGDQSVMAISVFLAKRERFMFECKRKMQSWQQYLVTVSGFLR